MVSLADNTTRMKDDFFVHVRGLKPVGKQLCKHINVAPFGSALYRRQIKAVGLAEKIEISIQRKINIVLKNFWKLEDQMVQKVEECVQRGMEEQSRNFGFFD